MRRMVSLRLTETEKNEEEKIIYTHRKILSRQFELYFCYSTHILLKTLSL